MICRVTPISWRAIWRGAALALFLPVSSNAADTDGNFAVKGSGLQTCVAFATAMDENAVEIGVYGGWIEGYLTGQNRRIENTFDATPWADTPTLLAITKSICTQLPADTRFSDAFDMVLRMLLPSRLRNASPMVSLDGADQQLVLYRDVLAMVRDRLAVLKFDVGSEVADPFDDRTRAALEEFQTSRDLRPTGLPDQRTLLFLFLPNAQTRK